MSRLACPICDTPVGRALPATGASFLRSRTGLDGEVAANFCGDCQHVFFSPILDAAQLQALYDGYRTPAYTEERTRHQPGYQAHADEIADRSSPHYAMRRAYYDFAVPELRGLEGLVVDFGGYDGVFARHAFPQAEGVVVDEGYERNGGDLPGLLARAALVFATHVFEHIPEPLPVLRRLADGARSGTLFFLEVPKEYGAVAGGTLEENFARMERRVAAGERPDHALLTFHEHVGHFSKASLKRLAERAGLQVQELHISNAGMLSVLARKP